jgi:hypothetical protein
MVGRDCRICASQNMAHHRRITGGLTFLKIISSTVINQAAI